MKTEDLHWLAGYLEGEGTFNAGGAKSSTTGRYTSICIQVSSTDRPVIERVAQLFGGVNVVDLSTHHYSGSFPNRKPQYRAQVNGDAAVELMAVLKPLLSERRQDQILNAILKCDRFAREIESMKEAI